MNKLLKSDLNVLLVIAFIIALFYGNTLLNGFAIDDHLFVVDWKITKNLNNIPSMFTKEFSPGGEHEGVYRPLRTVFYAISYQLFGANPLGYHIQALVIHLVITILIYLVVSSICHSGKRRRSASRISRSDGDSGVGRSVDLPRMTTGSFVPFTASLLFGLHPIHTEAIAYITASFDAIAYVFFFGAFYFFLRVDRHNIYKDYNYYISIVLALIGFFSLEMTLVLPILLILYDFCFRIKSFRKLIKFSTLKTYLPYFFMAGVYLFIRVGLLHITSRGEYLGGSFYITALTMVKVWLNYIWLLFFPLNLSVNPTIKDGINSWVGPASRTEELLSQSLLDVQTVVSIVVIILLLITAYKSAKRYPIISFSIGWFFISVLPVSYIIPQGPIMQERYIYLASFGFCLVIAYLLTRALSLKIRHIKFITIITIIILFSFYGLRTYLRSQDWHTGASIWFSLIRQIPNDPYTNVVIGNYYEQNQNLKLAAYYYQNALKNKPNYQDAYLKLALATIKLDKWNRYQENNLMFFYPKNWRVTVKNNLVTIKSSKNFQIELALDQTRLNINDYLKNQSENYGALLKQGVAYIPYFDQAFVKVFNDQGARKLQFFMFKKEKVLKVLVYPADSVFMKDFDFIISSVKIR